MLWSPLIAEWNGWIVSEKVDGMKCRKIFVVIRLNDVKKGKLNEKNGN